MQCIMIASILETCVHHCPMSIDAALLKLAQYPDFGRERNDIYNGARSLPIEKHIVFYQVSDNGIDVARILHQRMDLSKHF